MKQWYLFYTKEPEKLPRLVGELQNSIPQSFAKLPQLMGELRDAKSAGLEFPGVFALVPWGHHADILAKCTSVEEALFREF